MRKEIIEYIYKTFSELTENEKEKAIELEMKDHHWNDVYCDMNTEDFKYTIEELKKEYDMEFTLEWTCGASYAFINEIKFKAIYINGFDKENELEIEIDHYYGKDEIDCFFSFYSEDNAKKEDYKTLETIKTKAIELKDKIYKLHKQYEQALVYGWDEHFNEWLEEELEVNDVEYETSLLEEIENLNS